MKVWQKNVILVVLVVALVIFPLWFCKDAAFGGADGMAGELIEETVPGFQPWFEPLLTPVSGEVESMLFTLQAALGSGVVFFILGRITAKGPKEQKKDPSADSKQA